MGTAPPPAWGMISTAPPRRNGGNLDNKELVAGTTLYLPIFVDGALFSVGDGHGVQGDGEVCVTAVETGLTGTFRLTVRDDMRLEWPMAETPTHVITMAFDPDLDDCVVIALRQMLDLICARVGLDRYQAYTLASLAADLRVTQVVNGNKGIHVMLPSSIRSELDHVGHLVVLGIDDDDLLRSEEEPVAFHLRDLLADVARHRSRADARRYGLADRRLNIGCVGLHILDQLFDRVTLFQREIELGSRRKHVL